jgi:hypothetical protein
VSRWRVLLHIDIDANDEREAFAHGKKIEETLKNPIVRISLQSDGIRPIGDATVYKPTRFDPSTMR